jgi:hypothetical protein
MGTGYTRNDTANNIADGNVINASDLDGEFDAVQAAFNGTTGHSHDGTSGEGPQIAAGGIASNAVTTAKILDANVTLAKMAANSVDSDQYVDGSIDTAHIGNLQVTTAKIAADAIDGTKLADNAVDSEHYTDGSIDRVHLAADIVDGTKIADDSIDSEHYVDGSIDTAHIANDAVTLGTKTAGNYVAAGATSGTGISGSVSSEGGTFTVTSNATDANTAGTIVARDGSGNFSAGTITASLTGTASNANQLDSLDSTQFLRSDAADSKTAGDLTFSDSVKAVFGAGSDLQIYHDGSNSFVDDAGTGSLFLRGESQVIIGNMTGEQSAVFNDDGAVTLNHDNSKKLETTSGGVTVTGTATATTFSGDLNGTINTATTAATQTAGDNTTKVATTAFVTTAVNNAEPFPSGTSMLFQQTAAPTGWTKQTTHNNKAIRLTTGTVGTGGSNAFTTAFGTPSVAGGAVTGNPTNNHSVSAGNLAVSSGNLAVSISGNISNTTLSVNTIPSHTHNYQVALPGPVNQNINNASFLPRVNSSGEQDATLSNQGVTLARGNNGAHNHGHNLSGSMTGNPSISGNPTLSGDVTAGNLAVGASTASINVQYVDFIIANKD